MHLPNWLTLNSEGKIRKHWLAATSICLVICPLNLLTGSPFATPRQAPLSEQEFYETLAAPIIGLILLCLAWYCSYKKNGTKLLTFWLYTTPIRRLTHLTGSLAEIPTLGMLIGYVIDIAVFIWWYVLTVKLRHINKLVQEQRSLASQNNCIEGKAKASLGTDAL